MATNPAHKIIDSNNNSRRQTASGGATTFDVHPRRFRGLLAPGYFSFILTACSVLIFGCGESYEASPKPKAEPQPPAAEPAPAKAVTITAEKKAAVGVGKKGHYGKGIILTPLSSLIAAEELINFKIEIPKAMQMFKALHDRAPRDTDEYMEEIIKPSHIKLPELPDGQRYWYDPKTEELMVQTFVEEPESQEENK